MNIGKLLGVLSPGLSATGLFGHDAQNIGGGALTALSPMLALLMKHKKHGEAQPPVAEGAPIPAARIAPNPAVPPQAPVAPAAPAAPGGMDPAKRQRLAAMLMEFGGQMGGFQPRSY